MDEGVRCSQYVTKTPGKTSRRWKCVSFLWWVPREKQCWNRTLGPKHLEAPTWDYMPLKATNFLRWWHARTTVGSTVHSLGNPLKTLPFLETAHVNRLHFAKLGVDTVDSPFFANSGSPKWWFPWHPEPQIKPYHPDHPRNGEPSSCGFHDHLHREWHIGATVYRYTYVVINHRLPTRLSSGNVRPQRQVLGIHASPAAPNAMRCKM